MPRRTVRWAFCVLAVACAAGLLPCMPAPAATAGTTVETEFTQGAKFAPPWCLDSLADLRARGFRLIPLITKPISPIHLTFIVLEIITPLRSLHDLKVHGTTHDTLHVLKNLADEVKPFIQKTEPKHLYKIERFLDLIPEADLEIETFGESAFFAAGKRTVPLSPTGKIQLLETARGQLKEGNRDGAIGSYRTILTHNPGDFDALCELGIAFYQARQVDRAELALKHALAIKPDDNAALNTLGRVLELQGRHGEAEQYYRGELSAGPDSSEAVHSIAWVQFKQGNISDAIATLKNRVDEHPGEIESLYLLGRFLFLNGSHKECRYYLRLILILAPSHPEALLQLAESLLEENDAAGALGMVNAIAEPDSSNEDTLWLKIRILNELYSPKQALTAVIRLLKQYPSNHAARMEKARILRKLDRKDEALTEYETILSSSPKHGDALRERARLIQSQGESEQAEKFYKLLLYYHPDDPSGWVHYGRLLLGKGDLDAAERCFATARKLEYLDYDLFAALGEIAFKRGNYSRSEQYFNQALFLNPMDVTSAWYLSRIYSTTRRFGKAQELLESFLQLAPGVSFLQEELHLVKRKQRLTADTGYLNISTKGSSDFATLSQRFSGRFKDVLDYTVSMERMRVWEAREASLHQTNIGLTLGYQFLESLKGRLNLGTQRFSGDPRQEFKYKLTLTYREHRPKVSIFHAFSPMEESLEVIRAGLRLEELGLTVDYPFRPWLNFSLTPSWSHLIDGTNQKRSVKSNIDFSLPSQPEFKLRFATRFFAYKNELDKSGGLWLYFAPQRYITRSVTASWEKRLGRFTLTLGMERSNYEYRFLGASSQGGSTGYSLTVQGSLTRELYFILYALDSRSDTKTAASALEPSRSLFINLSYRL